MTFAYRAKFPVFGMWLLALLALTGFSIGCNPATLNYLLMPFVDARIPPKCKLAGDKEVQVAIVTNFATLETRPELLPAEMELSEKLAQSLRERFKENKEKVKIIPTARVKSAMNGSGQAVSPRDVGKQLKADYVISLEINSISLYENGSSRTLYRGNTEIAVNVFDMSKPDGESNIWQDAYRCEFPGTRGPIDAAGSSYQSFRSMFLTKVARDLSRNFSAHQPDEVRRMMD